MFKVEIFITLKESVLDPQGMAVLNALKELNYNDVESVRIGKYIQVLLNCKDENTAKKETEEFCKKLLVNDVIETYKYVINPLQN